MKPARIVAQGDSCVTLQFNAGIDPAVNAQCIAIAAALDRQRHAGVRDIVPTYNSVSVHFDPRVASRFALQSDLIELASSDTPAAEPQGQPITIPVTYGGEAGPDLRDVASFAGCSEAEVVRLHTMASYRVFMLGFLPGYAYMGTVDTRIAMPRLDAPRLRVPAGSVAIAGRQTGIYPCDTPGGWRVIGRTALALFDVTRPQPFLLKAGDIVKFVEE